MAEEDKTEKEQTEPASEEKPKKKRTNPPGSTFQKRGVQKNG